MPQRTQRMRRQVSPAAKMLAGGTAGIISKTAVSPLERVRILAQTGESRKGAIATLSRIVKEEGFVGLWRGNGTNCLRVFPSKAVLFSANDVYKSNLRWMMGRERLSPGYGFVTGSIAGVTACFCTLREEGFRGLYKGIYPTLLGSLLYEGIKFGAYDTIAWSMPKDKNGNLSIVGKLSAGAIAGSLAGFTVYPNDTVRRLLQMQKSATSGHSIKYTTAVQCYKVVMREEGFFRFYRGVGPYLMRMVPNAAIQFGVYEQCKQYFGSAKGGNR